MLLSAQANETTTRSKKESARTNGHIPKIYEISLMSTFNYNLLEALLVNPFITPMSVHHSD